MHFVSSLLSYPVIFETFKSLVSFGERKLVNLIKSDKDIPSFFFRRKIPFILFISHCQKIPRHFGFHLVETDIFAVSTDAERWIEEQMSCVNNKIHRGYKSALSFFA